MIAWHSGVPVHVPKCPVYPHPALPSAACTHGKHTSLGVSLLSQTLLVQASLQPSQTQVTLTLL